MNQGDYLNSLCGAWSECQGCMLQHERKNIIFGYGNPDAQLMIIGEAPGTTEDDTGIPFVGSSGDLLEYYLSWVSANLDQNSLLDNWGDDHFRKSRNEFSLNDIYFTNIVCCKPPENRAPTTKEIAACSTRLREQIYTVDPTLIITIGGLATEAVIGKKVSITAKRGQLFDSVIPGRLIDITYPVVAVLHMAYLLRRNEFGEESMGGKTYHDFVNAMHLIDTFNFHHRGIPRPHTRPPRKEEP